MIVISKGQKTDMEFLQESAATKTQAKYRIVKHVKHAVFKPHFLSIRWKLLLIWFVCIIIPITLVTAFFYVNLMNQVELEQLATLESGIKRTSETISSDIDEAVALSDRIFTDARLYEALDRRYETPGEFIDEYRDYFFLAWGNALPYNTRLRAFTIFTNNATVLNNQLIEYIDTSVLKSEWLLAAKRNDENINLINYNGERNVPGSQRRLFSLIRNLDFHRSFSDYTKILKVDFDPDMLYKTLRSEDAKGGIIYVLDEDGDIISSSSPEIEAEIRFGVERRLSVGADQFEISQIISTNSGWRVVGVFQNDFFAEAFTESRNNILSVAALVFLFSSFMVIIVTGSINKRLKVLVRHMHKAEKGEFEPIADKSKSNDELGNLIIVMNQMTGRIHQLIEDVAQSRSREMSIQLEKKQAELNALQSQVDPHFMFNVLETIRMKSFLKNEFETARIKLFRKLIMWDEDLIPVTEEMEFIKEFLEIQRYRFDNDLLFEINIDERAKNCRLPKMVLQTLVENACVHGLEGAGERGVVTITIKLEGEKLYCAIEDNGAGVHPEKLQRILEVSKCPSGNSGSIGIRNVVRRLRLYYGDNYTFNMSSELGENTKVELILPVDLEGNT